MKTTTLLFPISIDGTRVLLAMKKKGFGAGKYNGAGGKIEDGESIIAAAVREAEEEIGIEVAEKAVREMGSIRFTFEQKPEWNTHVHIFTTAEWSGEPVESDEMAPQWFPIDALPLAHMWVSDVEWVPHVLSGKRVDGSVHLDGTGTQVLHRELDFTEEK